MIKISEFGKINKKVVHQIELTSSTGVSVKFISFGALIRDWVVPVGPELRSVVLGFENIDYYRQHAPFFGAIVGRVANRIKHAKFDLDGQSYQLDKNDGQHQIHGGTNGLFNQIWEFETDKTTNQVCFSLSSEAGAMGYPGQIDFTITYSLRGNKLRIDLSGFPDQATPISLAQHNYFNLGSQNCILDHSLIIDADRYCPVDMDLIPTGNVLPVLGSKFDFQSSKTFRANDGSAMDYDINLLFQEHRNIQIPVAIVSNPTRDLTLKLSSDRPGLQLYNGQTTNIKVPGNEGQVYGPYCGFCLEDQMVPGALHCLSFPSIICSPDTPYQHWCEIEIG